VAGGEGDAMTSEEWERCQDPQRMLEFLRGKASDRKLRLFTVACCRRIWEFLTDEPREWIAIAEQYADGTVSRQALTEAAIRARSAVRDWSAGSTSNEIAFGVTSVDVDSIDSRTAD
jgi:hypothetical protein